MEETIDLREYFYIIKKRAWIIVSLAIIAIIASGVVSFFVLSPVYEAKTALIVSTDESKSDQSNTLTGDQFSVSQKLAVTYGEIIKSRAVLNQVSESLNLDATYEDIVSKITVSAVQDTQIIQISVQDTDAKRARDIANAIPKAFTQEAKRIMKANGVEVIDKAVTPKDAVKPNKMMNIAIAAVLGIMIGLFIIFVLEYMDNKMKTPKDIEKHLGIPLLGVVPMDKN